MPMHLVVLKLTYVFVSICKLFVAFSVHLSNFEFSFKPGSVWPDHDSFTLHIVVNKFTLVQLSIVLEEVFSKPVELSIYKLSFVEASFELELPLT